MADAGVAARRVCELMITEGKVRVNGEEVRRLPIFIDPEQDRVEVEGRTLRGPERTMYLMVNKPAGVLVTAADEPGMDRRTVLDLIDHPSASRLFPVGRLDWETTGLVLLTNDGEMANRLTHPRYGVVKTYEVGVRGIVDESAIGAVADKYELQARREDEEMGRESKGEIKPSITLSHSSKDGSVLRVTLREARNRQLREVLRFLGMPVKWLHRIAIGPLELSGLAPGRWRELERDEIRMLRDAARGRNVTPRVPKKQAERRRGRGREQRGGWDQRGGPRGEYGGGSGMTEGDARPEYRPRPIPAIPPSPRGRGPVASPVTAGVLKPGPRMLPRPLPRPAALPLRVDDGGQREQGRAKETRGGSGGGTGSANPLMSRRRGPAPVVNLDRPALKVPAAKSGRPAGPRPDGRSRDGTGGGRNLRSRDRGGDRASDQGGSRGGVRSGGRGERGNGRTSDRSNDRGSERAIAARLERREARAGRDGGERRDRLEARDRPRGPVTPRDGGNGRRSGPGGPMGGGGGSGGGGGGGKRSFGPRSDGKGGPRQGRGPGGKPGGKPGGRRGPRRED
jgi:23S rRNA pseudouridine2605 synthase